MNPVATTDMVVEILVAEDSSTQAEHLRHLLEQRGYQVTAVMDGRPALACLRQHKPALVISDINMPAMNGYELCQQIKGDERTRDIPVILLTSLSDAADVLQGLACGADSFITKPYSDSYLLACVERTLSEAVGPAIQQASREVEITLPGTQRVISADPRRMVSLLTSTYKAAVYRNTELVQAQEALRTLNDHLEDLVEERTAVLTAEIAERELAERKIRYLADVLENVSDAIVSLDLKGIILSWNAGAEALFGYRAEDVIGRTYAEQVPYDYLGTTQEAALQEMAASGRWRGEVRSHRQDGRQIYVLVASAVLTDKAGLVTGVSAVLHDITERKQAEAALAESTELLSRAEAVGSTGSWRLDLGADKVVWSAGLHRLFGLLPGEFEGTRAAYLARVHPDDRQSVRLALASALADNIPLAFECRIVRPDGEVRVQQARAEIVRDEQGSPTYLLGIAVDITERQQHERELEAIAAISTALRAANTQAQMLPLVLEQVINLLAASHAALGMRDPASDELVVTQVHGGLSKRTGQRLPAGAGIGGHVLATGQPYVSAHTATDPYYYTMDSIESDRALICVPLVTSTQGLGVLWAGRLAPFTASEVQVLTAIAGIAANAIQRSGLLEQTEQRLQRLAALREIDNAIMSSLDLRTTLFILLGQVSAQLGVDACDILLLKRGLNKLDYAAGRGFRTKAIEKTQQRLGEGHAGRAALERRLVAAPDLRADSTPFQRASLLADDDFRALFCVPLVAKGQVVGVLEVFHRAALNPDADWLAFLETLAGQAAIAVADAWMYNDLQTSNSELLLAYDTTLEGWSAALDLRDHETEGHSQRVTEMTMQLARALGMGEAEQEQLRRGALLHDIGKMGIPDAILLKPGQLTDAEWVIMRHHPQFAYDLLWPIAYLRPALDIPYCHHEKWDGSGYPRQLRGEGIPLAARIFAVVDVWDALRSDRPYRRGWPEDEVRAHIRQQSGAHFDPQVAAGFLSMIENPVR